MRTLTLLLCFTVLFVLGAIPEVFSQEKFVVLYTKGDITYQHPMLNGQRLLQSGQYLDADGVIECAPRERFRVLYRGMPVEFESPGQYDLSKLPISRGMASGHSFIDQFYSFVFEGVQSAVDPETLEGYHKEWHSSAAQDTIGYGIRQPGGLEIRCLVLEKVSGPKVLFAWKDLGPDAEYTFELRDSANNLLVREERIREPELKVKLPKYGLEAGATYYWQVRGRSDEQAPLLATGQVPFTYAPGLQQTTEDQVKELEAWQEAPVEEQILLLAFALEEQKLLYAADELYRHQMEVHPNSILLKRTFASFAAHYEDLGIAMEAMTGLQ